MVLSRVTLQVCGVCSCGGQIYFFLGLGGRASLPGVWTPVLKWVCPREVTMGLLDSDEAESPQTSGTSSTLDATRIAWLCRPNLPCVARVVMLCVFSPPQNGTQAFSKTDWFSIWG